MGRALANSMSDGLQTLTDGYNEGEWDRWAVDPVPAEVLGLKTVVGTVNRFEVSISCSESWDMSSKYEFPRPKI